APEDGSRTAERFDAPDHRRLDDLDHGLPVGHRKRNPIEQDLDAAHTERCPGPHPTNRNSLAQREMTPVVHPDARRHAENGLERKRRLERDLFRVANLDAQCIRCSEGGLGFPDGIDRNLGERELEGVALLCRRLKNVRPEESEDEKSDRPMSTPQGPPMTGRLADDYIPHIPIYVIRDRIHLTSCASASCETPTKSMTPISTSPRPSDALHRRLLRMQTATNPTIFVRPPLKTSYRRHRTVRKRLRMPT